MTSKGIGKTERRKGRNPLQDEEGVTQSGGRGEKRGQREGEGRGRERERGWKEKGRGGR